MPASMSVIAAKNRRARPAPEYVHARGDAFFFFLRACSALSERNRRGVRSAQGKDDLRMRKILSLHVRRWRFIPHHDSARPSATPMRRYVHAVYRDVMT